MTEQFALFGSEPAQDLPEGFRFRAELISPEAEEALLKEIRGLPFREFEFHGYVGKRRTVSFGWSYDFGRECLAPAAPIPASLSALRNHAAEFAQVDSESLAQVLVSEYGPGAEIGWHRDKAVFGIVVGVSLLSSCRFRLRRRKADAWERAAVEATPRSAYLLSGPARSKWEHSIPAVEDLRYSVTFRTLL